MFSLLENTVFALRKRYFLSQETSTPLGHNGARPHCALIDVLLLQHLLAVDDVNAIGQTV